MGQHAEDILNGDVDQFTGEWIGDGQGFSRATSVQHADGRITSIDHDPMHYAKGTKAIRKELAILIKSEKAKLINPTAKDENRTVDQCRQAINTKYGKGWREQY